MDNALSHAIQLPSATATPCDIRHKPWKTRALGALLLLLCLIFLPACSKLFGPAIVGKWQSTANSSNTLEFFSDGKVRDSGSFKTCNGTYTILDGERIKMEIEGVMWGTNISTLHYSISGDKLTLTTEGPVGIAVNWTRVK
jgi:hypothetical protein